MKKEELIEELISMGGCDAEEEWEKGYDSGINNAITLCNQLDEPELPVIPQFVAGWIEETQRNKRNIRDAFHEIITRGLDNENAEEWIEYSPDAFARACLYGYTVEKEKLYRVKLLPISRGYLAQWDGTSLQTGYADEQEDYENCKTVFTEQEIKAIDERYWAFREEVPNV